MVEGRGIREEGKCRDNGNYVEILWACIMGVHLLKGLGALSLRLIQSCAI